MLVIAVGLEILSLMHDSVQMVVDSASFSRKKAIILKKFLTAIHRSDFFEPAFYSFEPESTFDQISSDRSECIKAVSCFIIVCFLGYENLIVTSYASKFVLLIDHHLFPDHRFDMIITIFLFLITVVCSPFRYDGTTDLLTLSTCFF